MKKLIVTLAVAASFVVGGGVASATFSSAEASARTAILNCVIVDEAVKLGYPLAKIPTTVANCTFLKKSLAISRFVAR